MEIAAGLNDSPPADLIALGERTAARRAAAGPPPSQEEQLAKLDCTPTQRFAVDDPAWLEHLDSEGFAVVAGALTDAEEIAHAEVLLWEYLEGASPWSQSDPETWTDAGLREFGDMYRGIVSGPGIGHSPFMWFLRTRPVVRRAFERIWSTSDLISSFDGANIFRPWNHSFSKTLCGWWHADQGKAKCGRHAVQSFVSLYDAGAATGGLTVLPRSHLRHGEVVQDQANPSVDYCTVQPYSPLLKEHPHRLVTCAAGDLVLWDSRLVHANSPAPTRPSGPKDRLLRAVGYICMTPKAWASKEALATRRAAFEHDVGTSHWPHEPSLGAQGSRVAALRRAPPEVQALVG